MMGGARALLYPIQYPEAFGLVLVEAMLCGTPVAATRIGAVPDIVDDGVSGCLADNMDDFAAAAAASLELDRAQVRRVAEHRFSAAAMAARYENVYQMIVAGK
jgi:glycosyltransferase involved in cell wall biosynthesis